MANRRNSDLDIFAALAERAVKQGAKKAKDWLEQISEDSQPTAGKKAGGPTVVTHAKPVTTTDLKAAVLDWFWRQKVTDDGPFKISDVEVQDSGAGTTQYVLTIDGKKFYVMVAGPHDE